MENIPAYVGWLFALTTLLTAAFFIKSANNRKAAIAVILGWIALQGAVALTGFYTDTAAFPPRLIFQVAPPILFIIWLFSSARGQRFIDGLDTKWLTILHIVRIPVEIGLYWLFIHKTVPELMTFEGRNFDILSGITAPIIYYFAFVSKQIGRKTLLVWNLGCLALLLNIVGNAALSTPFPQTQLFAFDQPNIAILHFPFVWLPSCIVQLVLIAHLAAFRQLWNRE